MGAVELVSLRVFLSCLSLVFLSLAFLTISLPSFSLFLSHLSFYSLSLSLFSLPLSLNQMHDCLWGLEWGNEGGGGGCFYCDSGDEGDSSALG